MSISSVVCLTVLSAGESGFEPHNQLHGQQGRFVCALGVFGVRCKLLRVCWVGQRVCKYRTPAGAM